MMLNEVGKKACWGRFGSLGRVISDDWSCYVLVIRSCSFEVQSRVKASQVGKICPDSARGKLFPVNPRSHFPGSSEVTFDHVPLTPSVAVHGSNGSPVGCDRPNLHSSSPRRSN